MQTKIKVVIFFIISSLFQSVYAIPPIPGCGMLIVKPKFQSGTTIDNSDSEFPKCRNCYIINRNHDERDTYLLLSQSGFNPLGISARVAFKKTIPGKGVCEAWLDVEQGFCLWNAADKVEYSLSVKGVFGKSIRTLNPAYGWYEGTWYDNAGEIYDVDIDPDAQDLTCK